MSDELKDLYCDAYSKGLEIGRREVLEEVKEIVDCMNPKHCGCDRCPSCQIFFKKLQDITQTSNNIQLDLTKCKQKQDSEGCGKCAYRNGDFQFMCGMIHNGLLVLCNECKQKQEKKEDE